MTNEAWEIIEPLIVKKPRRNSSPGRPRISNRDILEAVLYVLKYECPWNELPEHYGFSGVTAWRRLLEWRESNCWPAMVQTLKTLLPDADLYDWKRGNRLRKRYPKLTSDRRIPYYGR